MPEPDTGRSARWEEAARRVRVRRDHGPKVRVISNQLALLLLIAFGGGFAIAARIGAPLSPVSLWQIITFAGALAAAVVGYISAKVRGRLLPQLPSPREDQALAPLLPEERRSLGRQLRGRQPASEESRALIRDLIAVARLNNRTIWPSLVGFFLWLVSQSLFLGWPWPLAVVALLIFLIVMTVLENRRWRRVLRSVG